MMMSGYTDVFRSRTKLAGAWGGVFAALSTAATVHGQTVFYVDDDAPAGGNGLNWSAAFSDLQDALWAASHIRDDVEIRIAEGIYKPDRGTGLRDGSFSIDNTMVGSGWSGLGLSLKGAFAGIKALDPNERDTNKFKSVLSGDLNGDDGQGFVNNGENSYHVAEVIGVFESGVGFDGLIFQGGNANYQSYANGKGGAIQIHDSLFVKINDCVFVDNWAYWGGAIEILSSRCHMTRCFFGGNGTNYSGGIIFNNNQANTRLANCVFSANTGDTYSSVIYNNSQCGVSECTFYGNTMGANGAVINSYSTITTVANSVFFSNTPKAFGSATSSNYSVLYCDVENGYPGEGNIDVDPLFEDPDGLDDILGTPDDNLLPRFGSPVIDAGKNGYAFYPPWYDYAGQPRIVDDRFTPDTGVGTGPIVDMGAYEFQPPSCYADLDQSTGVGVLDIFDFLRFQQLFVLNDSLACQVDRSTGNGVCDIFDFLAFQSEFAAGCP